jgi:hypothetical protein
VPTTTDIYRGVWLEGQNEGAVAMLRDKLRNQILPVIIVLQPGDGTRYEFLLVPQPTKTVVSHDGRSVETITQPRPALLVTRCEIGRTDIASCVADFARGWGIAAIRSRIWDDMTIANFCTREALAHTILAVWADGDTDD